MLKAASRPLNRAPACPDPPCCCIDGLRVTDCVKLSAHELRNGLVFGVLYQVVDLKRVCFQVKQLGAVADEFVVFPARIGEHEAT